MRFAFLLLSVLCAVTASAETKSVNFLAPADGATVSSPVIVKMGVEGMSVGKAGEVIEGVGHHHIIVNDGCVPAGTVIGAGEGIRHFGGGQTEATLDLQPGVYKLTMQFADGIHRSYGPEMCKTITVTVR